MHVSTGASPKRFGPLFVGNLVLSEIFYLFLGLRSTWSGLPKSLLLILLLGDLEFVLETLMTSFMKLGNNPGGGNIELSLPSRLAVMP